MPTTQLNNRRGPPDEIGRATTMTAVVQNRDNSAPEDLIEDGKLTPVIDRSYPLTELAAAIRHMLDGKARGKLVVSVLPGPTQIPAAGSTP